MNNWKVAFNKQWITDDDIMAVRSAMMSTHLTQGPRVGQFEYQVGKLYGRQAVAVCHGTCAIELALRKVTRGRGQVKLDPAPYEGVINAIRNAGLHLASLTTTSPVIRMTTSEFGEVPLELVHIFDAARAFGAKIDMDSYKFVCFSFHPLKTITTGEGGMILCADPADAEALRLMVNQGVGNYRMTEMQAALGLSQLERLDEIIERRTNVARQYWEAELVEALGENCVWNVAPMFVKDPGEARETFRSEGVDVRVPRPVYGGLARNSYVLLPIYPMMPRQDIDLVIETGQRVKDAGI